MGKEGVGISPSSISSSAREAEDCLCICVYNLYILTYVNSSSPFCCAFVVLFFFI